MRVGSSKMAMTYFTRYRGPPPQKISYYLLSKRRILVDTWRILTLKLWFAVHRMLQGCATDSFNNIFLQQAAVDGVLAPLSPDRSAHVCPLSHFSRFPSPPSLFLLFLLLPRKIDELFIRCGCSMLCVICTRAYGPTPQLFRKCMW